MCVDNSCELYARLLAGVRLLEKVIIEGEQGAPEGGCAIKQFIV